MYAVALVVGLVLAGVTGLIRDLRSLAHNLVVPHPDQHSAFLALLGRRLAVGLVLAGIVGLFMSARPLSDPRRILVISLAVGVVGFVLALFLLRTPCDEIRHIEKATVVRDIPPGGYGQVRFERKGGSVLLAAQNVDSAVIPAGCAVEVVDCTRSVVTIRKQSRA
jgi:hypothetical protein